MTTPTHEIVIPDSFGGAEHRLFVHDGASSQFADRLRKMFKERRRWAKRESVTSYRVYDADMPDFAFAIDYYQGTHCGVDMAAVHIAEYAAPKYIDTDKAHGRLLDAQSICSVVFNVPDKYVFVKQRERSKGGSQYAASSRESFILFVEEAKARYELDLSAYLDTGVFLDHRITRSLVRDMAKGKRFLNLFAYTGTASVQAALGGAETTTTLDLSRTYLDWARRNMADNGFLSDDHRFIQADVLPWITSCRRTSDRFDLIFVDPPTFSNSKSMGKRTWDVQRDHVELLIGVSRLLADGGKAVFSCNLRNFSLDEATLNKYGVAVEDITAQTIPHDFERNQKIHRCFVISRKR